VWAGAMMLDFLGEREAAALVMSAMEQALALGRVRTPDLGGKNSTGEMAAEIVRLIKETAR